MKVGELCERLQVPYRHARYVLEEGILPRGVDENPGRGDHRDLNSAQAFWLGMVLMLKQSGVKTPLAAKIADFAREGVKGLTRHLNWEHAFSPFDGHLRTSSQWFVDIGDLRVIRIATDANPSFAGIYEFPWSMIGKRETDKSAAPIVIIRFNISRLAGRLIGDDNLT